MTYIISDPHGCLNAYRQILKQIKFNDNDVLYVLGNIVDDGPDPIGLITEMSMAYNVLPVLGDDDYRAYKMLKGMNEFLSKKQKPTAEYMSEMAAWVADGGQNTLDGFRALDADMQEGILDYMSDMALYEETTVNGAGYLLVNSGIVDYAPDLDLDVCGPEDFITEPFDFTKEYDPNRVIIAGHTPVNEIPDAEKDKIFYGKNLIGINCDVANGGYLACLCLENGKEYYAKEA